MRKMLATRTRYGLVMSVLFGVVVLLMPMQATARLSVTLAWLPSEGDVAGYYIHYGTASQDYTDTVDAGHNTSVTIFNLKGNTTYYFAVDAYNSFRFETPPSNEVSYRVSPSARDTYSGLFYEDTEIRQQSSGSIQILVNAGSCYSGRVQIGSARYSFSGRLDSLLQAPKSLHCSMKNAPGLQLSLGPGTDPDEIVGQVTDGTWVSSVAAYRCPDNSPATQTPSAGSYTLIVPGRDDDPASPAGYGFGKARVNRGGVTSFIGILADGNKMSASSVVSLRGWWPVYIALNSGKESVIGWLQFADQADSDVNGTFTWIKSADPRALLYGGGFTNQCQASGSTYTPPPRGQPPLDPAGTTVVFSGGNLGSTFSEPLSFSGSGMNGDGLTGKFSSSSGTFKGVVADPVTHQPLVFQGAVVQKRSAGYGFVPLGNQSSAVTINQ